jgi:hypothetical protein
MNVLLFVTAMIMVLSMLTYAKLEMYRSFSLLQSQFTSFMEETERGYINTTAVWWYENSPAVRRSNPPNPPTARGGARSRLSFIVFIDRTKQAQYAQVYPKIVLLSKKLMLYLYKDQPFFKETLQLRPDILDGFLMSLMAASEALPTEQRIKKAADLANLNFGDPLLNSFSYFVLKGSPFPEEKENEEVKQVEPLQTEFIIKETNGEADDENGDPNKKEDYMSPEGYYSLLDYITVEDAIKIRVFLASKPLLMAIFDNQDVVNSIIAMRYDLYRKVVSGSVNPQNASTQFKTATSSKSDPNFDDSILDYSVTKTNPRNYE